VGVWVLVLVWVWVWVGEWRARVWATSLLAEKVWLTPPTMATTPVAVLGPISAPSSSTLATCAFVRIVRLGRDFAGSRKATAVLQRLPFRVVVRKRLAPISSVPAENVADSP